MAISLENINVQPLNTKHHVRGAFSCSVQKIQNYFRFNVDKQHDLYQVRAFVACEKGSRECLGFYYLNLTSYKIGRIDAQSDAKFDRVKAVPAVYLGMIGVHSKLVQCGIGKLLMEDAMRRTVAIGDIAGTYGLTLDALNDTLVAYYSQFGFEVFRDPDKDRDGIEMCLPLKTIQDAISSWK